MTDISKIKSNRFSYKEILELYPDLDYEKLAALVENLISEGKITPIKKSGKTSFRPSIYHEYKKLPEKKDYSGYAQEIKALHPRLNVDRYMKHPESYVEDRRQIQLLSNYFWEAEGQRHSLMSIHEKSFAVWGDEKFLDSSTGRKLMNFNLLNQEDLNYYTAPEPFFTSICDPDYRDKSVLISENKDSWYSLTKVLKSDESYSLCGIRFGLLVYGEGNKATREEALTHFLRDYVVPDTDIYYIGDIDIAGIDMLYRVMENNKMLKIQPFLPLYKEMLHKAKGREMNRTLDRREKKYNKDFLNYFTASEQELLGRILEEEKRIPQEILNYSDYQKFTANF